MKTIIFSINLNESDCNLVTELQNQYSISFRKVYNNLELSSDPEFLKSLPVKSSKQKEYLIKEVLAFNERNIANKERILENITKLESEKHLKLSKFRKLQKLRKSYNSKICFGDKKELIKLSKGEGDINIWKSSRLLPLVFYGETSRLGNRFFDLKEISEGKVLFKLESTDIKIPLIFNTKKYKNELIKLQSLILDKKIPVTIKLTNKLIYITYDESILNKTNVDIKAFYKEITDIKDKDTRRVLIANRYKEHEEYLKIGKLNRYLSIDLNPDGIGYCIMNKDLSIVTKGYLDISKVLKANKRRYETINLIKILFKLIKHYKCSYIVTEELNINDNDLGNRVSNRKVNNLWNRELINNNITKRCNETGTIRIEINPCYTSFIGNIIYKEYDPIASSMEICRRGINKYSKGGFYPELDLTNFINDKRYNKIKECLTWKELYSLFVTSKWSYRRKLKEFNFVGYNISNRRSMCKHIHFNNFL